MTDPQAPSPPPPDGAAEAHAATAPPRYERADVARVIRSKVQPPPLRGSTLSRQRLLERLRTATQRRVTLVVAEGGYGKTTLLTDFSSRSHVRCLWYKLDSTDRDAVTMVNYLIGAGREVRTDFAPTTAALLAEMASSEVAVERVLGTFMSELQQLADVPTALILDDFHTIDDSPAAADVVSRLMRDAPPTMSFVIASRRRPSVALARLAGMGELVELGTDDLRFSQDETRQLFAEAYGQPLDPDVLTELDARTEGWAASLQLLYSSIRGRPASAARSLAHALSGATSPIYDFLAEEVIGHLPAELEEFLVRAAVLERITPDRVVALFGKSRLRPTVTKAMNWIADADNRGLLSRGSQTTETRQFHPLLRDFLLRQLAERVSADEIREMHARVAQSAETSDPLAACHHYIEAGLPAEAMRCLGQSVALTMGSGRWGAASQLIGRLTTVPAEPALVAIQARRLFEEGDITGAAALLAGTDASDQPAAVRAVLRQTRVSMGWRSGDSTSLSATLQEIGDDPETPDFLREIAQVFVDSGPLSATPAPFPRLASRLARMADAQRDAGYDYYAAISLHNAAIASASAGRFKDAIGLCQDALATFAELKSRLAAPYSTHAVLATCELELGNRRPGLEELDAAVSSHQADGDVHAACAFAYALIGDQGKAFERLATADRLQAEGRSDISGGMFAGFARALLHLPTRPRDAVHILEAMPSDIPLDLELGLQHQSMLALAQLVAGSVGDASRTAVSGLRAAAQRSGRRFEVRMRLVLALAEQNRAALVAAIRDAASVGDLALLEVADAIGRSLHLVADPPPALTESIAKSPDRWLPVFRAQLAEGPTSGAHAAATMLEAHGTSTDVALLRAFDKTYRKRAKTAPLGRELARRVSPTLYIRDLGRVSLVIGGREVELSAIRRKPASLLMYLVTKPRFTATREQVLDDLWPESDPTGASNSLNQSLYFIRREIDPWYEDDLSVDYVCYKAELLWLDPELTRVASADFVTAVNELSRDNVTAGAALSLIERYPGSFCPEFEYEEWAIAWRTRVHASFLSFTTKVVDSLVDQQDLHGSLAVTERALAVDPTADDLKRRLIWLYWHTGATSAAVAQHRRLVAELAADGLDAPDLADVTSALPPRQ